MDLGVVAHLQRYPLQSASEFIKGKIDLRALVVDSQLGVGHSRTCLPFNSLRFYIVQSHLLGGLDCNLVAWYLLQTSQKRSADTALSGHIAS